MEAADPVEPVVPEPLWRGPHRPIGAPRTPLTRDAIVDAALRVLDTGGLEGLSMRRVGEELGTGPGSIYWHVRNKDELLQLLYERVTQNIRLPEPDPSRWPDQLRELGTLIRGILGAHRDIAKISLGRSPSGPTVARMTEWLFQLLTPVGVPDRVIAYVADLFSLYVAAYSFEESIGVASPTGEDLPPDQIVTMLREYLSALPVDRFPNFHRASGHIFDTEFDARFEFGLDIIIRGLRTYTEPEPS